MSRSTKSKALADLRARRNGLSAISRTDEYEVKDEDVYEKVGESDYQELVQRRREREDFVVDDGKFISILTFLLCDHPERLENTNMTNPTYLLH